MTLQFKDVRRILEILDAAENLDSLDIQVGDLSLTARKHGVAAPAQSVATARTIPAADESTTPVEAPTRAAAAEPRGAVSGRVAVTATAVEVSAPMAGTFYRTPAPGEPPFVEEGDDVQQGDTLCLVEVMKMFNTIPAPCSGRVVRVATRHGDPVKQGDQLVVIEPRDFDA